MIFIKKTIEPTSALFLVSAGIAWLISALVLTIAAALTINLLRAGENVMGYVSSVITFFAGCCAGGAAIRKRRKGSLFAGTVSAVAIITFALTLGFLISDGEVMLGGVLSLVSFTITGCLVGSVFFPGKADNKRKLNVKPSKRS